MSAHTSHRTSHHWSVEFSTSQLWFVCVFACAGACVYIVGCLKSACFVHICVYACVVLRSFLVDGETP